MYPLPAHKNIICNYIRVRFWLRMHKKRAFDYEKLTSKFQPFPPLLPIQIFKVWVKLKFHTFVPRSRMNLHTHQISITSAHYFPHKLNIHYYALLYS